MTTPSPASISGLSVSALPASGTSREEPQKSPRRSSTARNTGQLIGLQDLSTEIVQRVGQRGFLPKAEDRIALAFTSRTMLSKLAQEREAALIAAQAPNTHTLGGLLELLGRVELLHRRSLRSEPLEALIGRIDKMTEAEPGQRTTLFNRLCDVIASLEELTLRRPLLDAVEVQIEALPAAEWNAALDKVRKDRLGFHSMPAFMAYLIGDENRDAESVEAALKEVDSIDTGYVHKENGQSNLTAAAINGKTHFAVALVRRGASLDHRDKTGRTPLAQAAVFGQTHTTEALMDELDRRSPRSMEAQLRKRDNANHTPLMATARYGQPTLPLILSRQDVSAISENDRKMTVELATIRFNDMRSRINRLREALDLPAQEATLDDVPAHVHNGIAQVVRDLAGDESSVIVEALAQLEDETLQAERNLRTLKETFGLE